MSVSRGVAQKVPLGWAHIHAREGRGWVEWDREGGRG